MGDLPGGMFSHDSPCLIPDGRPTLHRSKPISLRSTPFRQGAGDIRVMDGRLALGVCGEGEALPLHPGIEHPSDEVKDALIAQFALGPTLGHGEVR